MKLRVDTPPANQSPTNAIDCETRSVAADPIDLELYKPSPTGSSVGPGATSPTRLIEEPLNHTRKTIALRLIWMLAGLIGIEVMWSGIFGVDCWIANNEKTCDLATRSLAITQSAIGQLFTAMIGLVGSVVGFYFGSNSDGKSK